MRAKLLFLAAFGSLAFLTSSQAGWHGGGCYGGGWHGGGGYYGGGGWGGWGWGGPAIGISFAPAPVYYAAPAPVYRTVYYAQPAPVAYYSDPVLAAAQNRLGKLGYYSGYVDGQFGPRTNRALIQYQADYGLPITGRLDSRTRASLGV